MVQSISREFTALERVNQLLHFFLCNSLDIFTPWPRKHDSYGHTIAHALHKWLISIFFRKMLELATHKFTQSHSRVHPQVQPHRMLRQQLLPVCSKSRSHHRHRRRLQRQKMIWGRKSRKLLELATSKFSAPYSPR